MGRFYKTTMPTYENFVDEIPYELMGLALAKKEQDLANTEQGLLNAGQSLNQMKTKARTQDLPVLEEKISEYQKIIDDATQKLLSNPGEYRNTSRQLKQVSAKLQNEINNGDIGKIIREYDHYQNFLKSAAEKRDLHLKSGKGDNVLIGQEYERMVAKENEEYKGYKESARGGNFSKWDIHGTDFRTEANKIISKIKPTTQDWEKLENFASAKITASGSSTKISDNIILKAMYDFMQTPTGQLVIARDVNLDRYDIEDINSIFVADKQGNIILNPDPKAQNAFKAIANVLIAENKQSKTSSKRDESQWSATGKKALEETTQKLNTQFKNNYFIGNTPLTVVNVDAAGTPYYGITIGNKEYAVAPDVLEKANIPGFTVVEKQTTPPEFDPVTKMPITTSAETNKYYHESEIRAYDALLELQQTNQERNAKKQAGAEFYKTGNNIIKTVGDLNRTLGNGPLKVSANQKLEYGGVVLPKFQDGGVTRRKSGSLYPNNIQTAEKKSTNTPQQTQPKQPVFIGFPSSTVNYSTPNKNYDSFITDIKQSKGNLAKAEELDTTTKALMETKYKNSTEALSNLNVKVYEMMKKEGVTKLTKEEKQDIIRYGFLKKTGGIEDYYASNPDKTLPIEELLNTALSGNKNKAQLTQKIVAKTFFSQDESGNVQSNLKGVFVDDDGKVLVTPETFLQFYETVMETHATDSFQKGGGNTKELGNFANFNENSEFTLITKNLKNTYNKVKKEIETKDKYFQGHINHLDKLQNMEEASNIAIDFTPEAFERSLEDGKPYGQIPKDVTPLKNNIYNTITSHIKRHPELVQEFKSFIKYENVGENAGESFNVEDIIFPNFDIKNLMITQRGIDLVIKNNENFDNKLGKAMGFKNEFILTLPNDWKSTTNYEKKEHTWKNLTNAVVNLVKEEYADNLQQAGITDPFDPIYKLGDKSFDLSDSKVIENGGEQLRLLAENRNKYIVLTNINLAKEIAENYANLPVAQLDLDFTQGKTGFVKDAKRQPNTNFVIFDPKSKLNFKVSKIDEEKFAIFVKDFKGTSYTKISEVGDNPINLQKEIIEFSEKVYKEKK